MSRILRYIFSQYYYLDVLSGLVNKVITLVSLMNELNKTKKSTKLMEQDRRAVVENFVITPAEQAFTVGNFIRLL